MFLQKPIEPGKIRSLENPNSNEFRFVLVFRFRRNRQGFSLRGTLEDVRNNASVVDSRPEGCTLRFLRG